MNELFTVVFEDGEVFKGGTNYFETKWKDIPDKKIRSLFYRISGGDYLCLTGYDKYYHLVEGINDLNGENKGQLRIVSIRLMARVQNKIKVYNVMLDGTIKIETLDSDNELIKRLNNSFWK